MIYLIFNTGVNKWFRGFNSKNKAHSFKQFTKMSVTVKDNVRVVNKEQITSDMLAIDDDMFEKLVEICKREIGKEE